MRRARVQLTYAQLHELLRLAPDIRVVAVTATIDPPVVSIIAESRDFNDAHDFDPAPVANLEYLR